jgi:hypothetical protein
MNGQWHLDGFPAPYDSLAALSGAIGAKTENAWTGWRYRDQEGGEHFIDDLRAPGSVRRRPEEKE